MTRLAVIGDALLDRDLTGAVERVAPDAPVPVVDVADETGRPGGAALAAVLLASDGDDVVLVTAIGRDAAGRELSALLAAHGVEVVDLGLQGATPEKIRVRAAGQSLLRLDRGGAPSAPGALDDRGRALLAGAAAVLVADYGRGLATRPDVRQLLAGLGRTAVVWDPHRRGPEPVPGARLVTPNSGEAASMCPAVAGHGLAAEATRAETLAARWSAGGVAVTLGRRGALLAGHGGSPLVVPVPGEVDGDPCGAGDRFAGAAARALAHGAVISEAVEAAVHAATAFVAAGAAGAFGRNRTAALPGSTGSSTGSSAAAMAASVRAAGGTVVATGGCFDLLHAGHVATLRAARRLGDCLIVCLNSDASVRRLKGADRPLQPAADRAALLAALDCVDGVEVFEEDTPVAALERLRPDVFVKGGDYAAVDLPEAATLAQWGGQAVVVPYLAGRSSSRLIEEVRRVPS